jgi:hypothetical protein
MGLIDTIRGWFRPAPVTEADLEREDYEGLKEDAFVSQSYAGAEAQEAARDDLDAI